MKNDTLLPAPITSAGDALYVMQGCASLSFPLAPVPLVVTLKAHDGTQAQLTVNNGALTFEGEPDTATAIFLNALKRRLQEQMTCFERKIINSISDLSVHYSQLSHSLVFRYINYESPRII